MDEKEILQRQVDALEKLLSIKEAIIKEQETKVDKLHRELASEKLKQPYYMPQHNPYTPLWQPHTFIPPSPFISQCTDGKNHEWGSLSGPCIKCGVHLVDSLQITSDVGSQLKTDV